MQDGHIPWINDVPESVRWELQARFEEMSRLEQEQVQVGTSIPTLYGTISKFVANPSTVSVETYKRMLETDETLGSGIDFMNLAMVARFGDYKHASKEITDFVRNVLKNMAGSWHENLIEMFSAEWAGFSLSEQVWKFDEDFMGTPAFVPKKLVTYPPLTIVFAVNQHGELHSDGIYQYQRYHNTFFSNIGFGFGAGDVDGFRPDLFASTGNFPYPIRISADLSYLTVRIPTTKCIHLRSSVSGNFNNPYGLSCLRRAYKNWVTKDAFLKMWLVAADRKGTPLVVGYAAPNDTVYDRTNNQADVARGVPSFNDGQAPVQRSDIALANAFRTVHNSSFLVLPGKKGEMYDIEAIQVQGDMNVFKDGVDYWNKALMRSILIPPLVMSGGDGAGSYALGQEHNKIFKQIVDGKLKVYKQGILEQFVRKIVAYNFPKVNWEKEGLGDFLLEEYDVELMEKLGNIFASATTNGYLSPEDQIDVDHVRDKLNLPKNKAKVPMQFSAEDQVNF